MDRFTAAERALRSAAPHALAEAVADVLTEHFGATSVELLMADYAMTSLQPVSVPPSTAEPLSIHDSRPGRAFGTQEPLLDADPTGGTVTAHLPITVRGDRTGVLRVTLPADLCDEERIGELVDICEVLGHEIHVAERDTDVYLQARRAFRLTLAAEMQWHLLPGRACSRPEFALGAQLEPAYAIHGDNFDWSTSADHLTLTLTNGMGEGIEASLLTNLAVNALRNARRGGLGLADQAGLADQVVYAQHRGAAHVSVLLLRFHLTSGRVEVVDAGSPRLWLMRDGGVEPVTFDAQLPLGMFEETLYVGEEFEVRPGDRMLFVSDGVYDVVSAAGERYGERALARALTATRFLPPSQVPRAVLRELTDHRGALDLDDDAMVVCLDWYGRPA